MTDLTYCIRGCKRPCNCNECTVADIPSHEPIRREATRGYLCDRCADRLARWLTDIPDLYATLNPYERPEVAEHERISHGKISGSPALVRLDVLALQDDRTIVGDIVCRDGFTETDDGLVNIVATVGGWAMALADEHNIRGSLRYLTDSCGLLTRWIDELCASPWVDECYDELRDVMAALNRAHGVERPRPIASCINLYRRDGELVTCGATLYKPRPGGAIRCRECGRRYTGAGLIMLARDQETENARQEGA